MFFFFVIPLQALIKRVIAVDGDNVEIKDGALFINGEEQFEDYTFEVGRRPDPFPAACFGDALTIDAPLDLFNAVLHINLDLTVIPSNSPTSISTTEVHFLKGLTN